MQIRIRKATYAGTALLACALIVLFIVVTSVRRDQATYQELVHRANQIHEVIDIGPAALSALKDAETGQQGYLLTGKPSYLTPYSTGIHEFRQLIPVLYALTRADAANKALVDRLSDAGMHKLDELAVTLSLYNEGKKQAAIERVSSGLSKTFMDGARAATAALVTREEAAFAASNRATSRAVRHTRARFYSTTAVLSLLMILGTLLLSSQLRKERQLLATVEQSEARYRDLNASLGEVVAARTRHLEDVNASLNAFSYSVSHDLRAPLRSIDGFSLMILEDYSGPLRRHGPRHAWTRVRAAASRMGLLIQSLLDLSRVTAVELSREKVSLSDLARSIVDGLRAASPGRDVEVAIPSGLEANADPSLTRIVLDNLLSNAWKFSSRQPVARIEMGAIDRDGQPVFYVRDNGAGFAAEAASRLFTPFQRLHTDAEFDGTGIGLATVQRVVQRHDGRIWVESAPGKGATFFFTLLPCKVYD